MKTLLTFSMVMLTLLNADGGILEVKWPKVDAQHQKVQKAYPEILRKGIAEVKLPVYLPKSYIYNQKMSIIGDENYYAITLYLKGATLFISGDRTYQQKVVSGANKLKTIMKASKVAFNHAEGMMMTDFNRHGVNYTLSLECDLPANDKRCNEEAFLRKIYSELTIVGGKR
ncbi:MAG: hypothetical protein K0U38_11520 [Epsilonproteobacteria bacterium]|nr:hypothetical protein [Campylobacterota bacterium]